MKTFSNLKILELLSRIVLLIIFITHPANVFLLGYEVSDRINNTFLDLITRVVKEKAYSCGIKLPEWMENYYGLEEKFLEKLNSYQPLPQELFEIESKYHILENFGFDILCKNLMNNYDINSTADILFHWWIYGVRMVLSLEKGSLLSCQLLDKSLDNFIKDKKIILDLGSGNASTFPFLLNFFNQLKELVGVEISPIQIDYAEVNFKLWGLDGLQGQRIKIVQGDILNLKEIEGIEGKYDMISLFHPFLSLLINVQEASSLFKGIKECLSDDGIVMIMISKNETASDEFEKVLDKLKKAGFLEGLSFSTLISPERFALDQLDSQDLILVGGRGEVELFLEYLEEEG